MRVFLTIEILKLLSSSHFITILPMILIIKFNSNTFVIVFVIDFEEI
jgi:hypothetical protein